MREIKFRAWDKDRKEYLSGGQIFIAINPGQNPTNDIYLDIIKNPNDYKDRFILEQFTGLHDSKGVEIFEGDILDCIYKSDGCNHKLQIVWVEASACFRTKNIGECHQPNVIKTMFDMTRSVVIGNKFENKELLEI